MIQRLGVAVSLSLILCVSGACIRANAQETTAETDAADRDRGIKLYQQGQIVEAIKILKRVVKTHADDADAWYFLGLAYYSNSAFLWARDALEHSVSLRPDSADANAKLAYALILGNEMEQATTKARHAIELGDQSVEPHYAIAEASFRTGDYPKAIEEADQALKIKSDFAPALITKSLAHYFLKQYAEAAASLEKFLAVSPNDPDADVWREQLDSLRTFGQQTGGSTGSPTVSQPTEDVPLNGRDVTRRARVLDKPEPTYTEAARKAGVNGTVVMRCVFGSDGEIRNLVVMKALGYGLTSRAAQAARKIRFTPATKDGKQVSTWIELQYNFNLY
ncbi:MAG TPA: TonB family protein [Pyrinomonadaceae bacterium]